MNETRLGIADYPLAEKRPQDVIMEVYELLRPGRVLQKQQLHDAADRLRREYQAPRMAAFVEEAADVYERRGLFTFRY